MKNLNRIRTIVAWLLVGALTAEAPLAVSPQAVQQTPPAPPNARQPLPDATIRQADLALEAELKREAALISGDRVGTDGAAVSQTLELGLVLTRDLWVAMLRQRAQLLEKLKVMTREEKVALLEKLLKAAVDVDSAYLNMVVAEGPALQPGKFEKARYEGLLRDADTYEKAGNATAAAEARDRAARSLWKFYADRRQTFFSLLEQDEVTALLGLYSDNWVYSNKYLFQTLLRTRYSSDPTVRQDEMIADLDGFLDANIGRLGKIADEAEAIDEFKKLLEFASPKYAKVHQMAVMASQISGMTAPRLFVYPLVDVGKSYAIAEQLTDTAREILISLVCLAALAFPIAGAIVNAGVAIIEVVNEGGQLVVHWRAANDARQTAAVSGQIYVMTEDDKTRARAGRLIFAMVQVATSVPFVGPAVRDARAAQVARARGSAPAVVDASLADAPSVQRGVEKARELGMSEEAITAHLNSARTQDRETLLKLAREQGYTGETAENVAEAVALKEFSRAKVTANAFSQIGELKALEDAAFAAGVTQREIDAMVDAAKAVGTLKALGQELPVNLLRATLDKRGVTVVVDQTVLGGVVQEGPDWQWEKFLDFFHSTPPARVLRGDMVTVLNLRTNLRFMQEGRPVFWSNDELSSLDKMLKRTDLSTYYEYVSDEGVLTRIFDDDVIEFGRRFLAHPNREVIASGKELLPPFTPIVPTVGPAGPVPIPYPQPDPFARWIVTGSVVTGALGRLTREGDRQALDPGGDPFTMVGGLRLPVSTSGVIASTPSTLDLEQAAFNHARSAFGQRTANWTVSVLPDGQVAVTSPDGQRRVTARSIETTKNGEYRIVFTTESIRGRFIDHVGYYNGTYLEVAIPSPGQTVLPSLGVPTRPPSTAFAATGSSATTPRQTSALTTPDVTRNDAFAFVGGAGSAISAGSENVWEPKLKTTNTRTTAVNYDFGTTHVFAGNGLAAFQLATVISANLLNTTQGQAATAEEGAIEVPAGTQPAPREHDLIASKHWWPSIGGDATPALSNMFSLGGGRRSRAFQAPRPSNTDAAQPLKIILTSLGRSTGEAVQMVVINQGPRPVTLAGDGFVLEPVARVTAQMVQDELKRFERAGKTTVTLNAYCLDLLKDPPAVGTVFRLADRAAQQGFDALRPIFAASRALRAAGRLPPDAGDEKTYFDAIRQWAIWTQREKFDERRFTEAFVEHARKNLAAAGRRWTDDLGKALRQLAPGRWRAIQLVLQEAGRGN